MFTLSAVILSLATIDKLVLSYIRSDWEIEEISVKPSVQVQMCLRPENSEVKARPGLTSSLNVSRSSQWCRSWISVQTGRLRCGLPLFIK